MPSQDFWNSVNEAVKPRNPCSNDCHAEISESLRQLHAISIGLARHLNTHSPVNRLPPELLGEIFLSNAQPPRLNGTYQYEQSSPVLIRTLLSITQVCGTWRETAHSNPLLWTQIPIGNRGCASAFLDRSKGADITLWGPVYGPSKNIIPTSLVAYEEHMHRIQSLSIMFPKHSLSDLLPLKTVPKLQTMELFSTTSYMPRMDTLIPLHWDTPVLKSLTLHCISPSWAWVAGVTSLTSLTVDLTPQTARSETTVLDILDTLRDLQNLSFLRLRRPCRPFDAETFARPVQLVTLPRLEHFLLSGPNLLLHQFLVHMSLPNNAVLDLDAYEYMHDTQYPVAVPIAQNYRIRITDGIVRNGPFHGLTLHFDKHHVFWHMAQNGQQMYSASPLSRPTPLYQSAAICGPYKLTIRTPGSFSTGVSQFPNTFIEQKLLYPDTLIIIGPSRISVAQPIQEDLLHWMSQQRLVRIMFVSTSLFAWFAEKFVDHIGTAGPGNSDDEGRLCLPFLEHLQISDFNFRDKPEVISQLIAGIGQRPVELPPMVIRICNCEIGYDQVEALQTAFQKDVTVE